MNDKNSNGESWYGSAIAERQRLVNRLCIQLYLASIDSRDASLAARIMESLENAAGELEKGRQEVALHGSGTGTPS